MRNINIKGILIDTDKTFHLHISLSIRSNGKNVDIYVITSTRSKCLWTWSLFLLEERNKSFSLWKCKELPIQNDYFLYFSFVKQKTFQFWKYIIHYKQTNMMTQHWGRHVDFKSNCHQSTLLWSQSKNLQTVSLFI